MRTRVADEGSYDGRRDRQRSYSIPRNATQHGGTAFAGVVDDFVDMLTQRAEAEARRAHGGGQEITADHVAAARADYERRQQAPPEESADRSPTMRTASTMLLTAGGTGAPMMAAFLHSPWQIALFTLFVLGFVVGLALSWVDRRRS